METTKFQLDEKALPESWYNLVPDLPFGLEPPLNPATREPVGPEAFAPIFPEEIIRLWVMLSKYVKLFSDIQLPDSPGILPSIRHQFRQFGMRWISPPQVADQLDLLDDVEVVLRAVQRAAFHISLLHFIDGGARLLVRFDLLQNLLCCWLFIRGCGCAENQHGADADRHER
jgi:hypothetical protein